MSLTVNAKAYTVDSISGSTFGFQGPANTVSVKDRITQKSVPPKPTATFSGNSRFEVALYRTHTLTGAKTTTADGSTKIAHVFPVGVSSADIDAHCNDLGAYIASAAYKTAVKNGQANG
jgi:hypothetical protein